MGFDCHPFHYHRMGFIYNQSQKAVAILNQSFIYGVCI